MTAIDEAWGRAVLDRIPAVGRGTVPLAYCVYGVCAIAMFAMSYATGSWASWLFLAPLWTGVIMIGKSAARVEQAAGNWDTDESLAIHSFKGDLRFLRRAPLLFFWAGLIANTVQHPARSLIADACWCATTLLIPFQDAAVAAKFDGRSGTDRGAQSN